MTGGYGRGGEGVLVGGRGDGVTLYVSRTVILMGLDRGARDPAGGVRHSYVREHLRHIRFPAHSLCQPMKHVHSTQQILCVFMCVWEGDTTESAPDHAKDNDNKQCITSSGQSDPPRLLTKNLPICVKSYKKYRPALTR